MLSRGPYRVKALNEHFLNFFAMDDYFLNFFEVLSSFFH